MSVDVRDEHNIMSDGTGTEWNKTSAERLRGERESWRFTGVLYSICRVYVLWSDKRRTEREIGIEKL